MCEVPQTGIINKCLTMNSLVNIILAHSGAGSPSHPTIFFPVSLSSRKGAGFTLHLISFSALLSQALFGAGAKY